MAVADLVSGRIEVDVPQRETNLIKQVPGARYHGASQRWRVTFSWAACKQLRGVFGDKLHIGETLAEWAWVARQSVQITTNWRAVAMNPEADYPGDPRLRKFQRTGVRFLQAAGSAILADDLGTGKTVQSLSAVEHWPLLIVTTKSCKTQWAEEVRTWTGAQPYVLDGGVAARRKILDGIRNWNSIARPELGEQHYALIVNYHQLPAHSRLAPYGSIALSDKEREDKELNSIAWGTVIADEAHKAKEPKTKHTRALWALGDKAKARFALTGTPREGSLLDFWSLLRFVQPTWWPTRTGFVDRYCVTEYNFFGGLDVNRLRADTEDEFREIMELSFLRRPKALVAPDLPPKVNLVREVELPPKAAKVYKQLKEELVAELDNGQELVAFTDLSVTARLSQLALAWVEETEDGEYRLTEPSPKLDELEDILEELGNEPAAVFSDSRQLLALAQARMEKAKIPYGVIAGDIPQAARDMARDDYNAGLIRVLLISLRAGAEGLNLKRGSTEIFLNRSWSFLTNSQAEDRMHGIGRGEPGAESITVIDIVCKKTVDEGRTKLFASKGEAMEHLVRDREVVKRMLDGVVR